MTDWRTLGDIDIGIWTRTLYEAGSPLKAVAADAYKAASPHTALCLAMLRVESFFWVRFNNNTKESNNPLNLRPPVGGGYMQYDDPVEGIRAWRERITDDEYKNRAYGNTVTIADLVSVYAPSKDGNNEAAYVASIAVDLVRWGITPQEVTPMSTPTIYDLSRDYARFGLSNDEAREVLSHRFDNRNGIKPKFIVLHIQAGTSKSSLDWWANAVQASSTVMIQHDGSVLNIIPTQHGPWTNGDDANPTPNGARLVNLPGNSNLYTLSIEAEGMDGSDTTSAQLDSIVWQVEKWMAEFDIPKANILRHGDINSVTRPNCPGAYYAKVMARIGETPLPNPERKPYPITWEAGDVGPQTLAGKPAIAFLYELTAKKDATRRVGASSKEPTFGAKIKQGEKVTAIGTVTVDAGKTLQQWYILDDLARVIAGAFEERLPKP